MAEAKRLEGVNKPELLPKEFTTVIDVAGFLSAGQVSRYSSTFVGAHLCTSAEQLHFEF